MSALPPDSGHSSGQVVASLVPQALGFCMGFGLLSANSRHSPRPPAIGPSDYRSLNFGTNLSDEFRKGYELLLDEIGCGVVTDLTSGLVKL